MPLHNLTQSLRTSIGKTHLYFALPMFFFCAFLFTTETAYSQDTENEYSVYQYVVQAAEGTFEEIAVAIDAAATDAGFQMLAAIDAGVPDDCPYRARVFVLYDETYAQQLMDINPKTAPFAVVDRINLFEDENGIHVAVVNPHSINRTVLMDDMTYQTLAEDHLQAQRNMIASAVQGTTSNDTFGQKRKRGYIGKTMGVMAGGPFEKKVGDEMAVPGDDWRSVASSVREGLSQAGDKWGMHLVYELELPEHNTMIFGSTGSPMDSKSFSIVSAGGNKSRKGLACPGLTHAGAYPLEVVVAQADGEVKVRFVNAMYRMKMYFEDAGKWAFMKNMGMPGSIAKELNNQLKSALNHD